MIKTTLAAIALICATAQAQTLTPPGARAIAREATIYGFPLVDSYRIQYSYFVDRSNPELEAAGYREEQLRRAKENRNEPSCLTDRTLALHNGCGCTGRQAGAGHHRQLRACRERSVFRSPHQGQ